MTNREGRVTVLRERDHEAPMRALAARGQAHLARRGMAIRDISRIPCEGCGVHVKDTRAIGAAVRRCG